MSTPEVEIELLAIALTGFYDDKSNHIEIDVFMHRHRFQRLLV
jgi:hypothetical protein